VGEPRIRRVHSVGSGSSLAGGVQEVVAHSDRAFGAAFNLSGGRALRSFAAERPFSPRLQFFGGAMRGLPPPVSVLRRFRVLSLKKELWRSFTAPLAVQGVRLPVVRRLPGCWGSVSVPRLEEQQQRRAAGPFWPSSEPGSSGPFCNFSFVLDLSVRIEVSI
jgi:hypothetical protein